MISKLSVRARREGLRSRSAYKLLEINNKYKIIRKGNSVLDLGCWPGGWMVVAKKFSGNYILGVDIKEIKSISNCEFLKADIYSEDVINLIKKKKEKFDVVISDLAPNTTGIKELDRERSKDLCFRALEIAKEVLIMNGHFVCKIFQGREHNKLFNMMKKKFRKVRVFKPSSSKKRSVEVYVLGIGYFG